MARAITTPAITTRAITWESRLLGSRAELAGLTATVSRNGFSWSWRIEDRDRIICNHVADSETGAQAAAEAYLAALDTLTQLPAENR